MSVQSALLPDGRRLHLNHGPIDVIIEAWGMLPEVKAAYEQATASFRAVLPALVAELPVLRQPLGASEPAVSCPIAQRMLAACWPHRESFITPMAAVAGAVADHLLEALVAGRSLTRAYVNDGGDVALHLGTGETFTCGLVADPAAPSLDGKIEVSAEMPVRGIATSGAATKGGGGRSFSLGIAEAVTVLARDAAAADAAATVIANAVDLPGHESIVRIPASDIDPDSDLGDRTVTLAVGTLQPPEIDAALAAGRDVAERLRCAGLIFGAVLILQGQVVVCGDDVRLLRAA